MGTYLVLSTTVLKMMKDGDDNDLSTTCMSFQAPGGQVTRLCLEILGCISMFSSVPESLINIYVINEPL